MARWLRGGVGFFADAGEQARLYWIKVSKNEDWLGRVCAFLSGGIRTPRSWSPSRYAAQPRFRGPGPPANWHWRLDLASCAAMHSAESRITGGFHYGVFDWLGD
jgi:hypothetical protein